MKAKAVGGPRAAVARWGRWVLLAVGLGAVTVLVRRVGAAQVGAVLVQAGPWVPVVFALEALWMIGSDVLALRALSAERSRDLPWGALLRASAVAYAFSILVPAGRAAGEVARGTLLSSRLGVGRATATGAHMHAVSLLANALMCAIVGVGVASAHGVRATLTLFIAANAVFVSALALVLLSLARSERVGAWAAERARRFGVAIEKKAPGEGAAAIPARAVLGGVFAILAGRWVQCAQYGIILYAVSGHSSFIEALTAHAIHLVGANLGDVVPGQMGVTEASYSNFAPYLGLADAPARALSIPLLVRIVQIALATTCMVAVSATRPRERSPAAT